MPKFYVSSGDLNVICECSNPDDAALIAFQKIRDYGSTISVLSKYTSVNEHGFDSAEDDVVWYTTSDILEETDQVDSFKILEWIE